ncbi:taurine catabolism dioxygenase TauD [Mycobacterium gordonae]|uniref:Taurine catabolism dioxygenase TauD n=1 Tax=Mycobacterium gordonae TaxID=1778 RepID=A0A0Q2RIW9_MYCGO|nr:TauD/TfdA family dioxygenase [Mycobacterium gordonae]KQH75355.1 taurine catabolism dioxygenase TauD [Mycobacterium gordonae]
MQLYPLTPLIGTEVRGIDVNQPIDAHIFDQIYEAWIDSTVLLIRGQSMTPRQQVEFTARFGEVFSYTRSQFNHPDQPEILILSNLTRNKKPIGSAYSGRVWHTDGHYLERPPAASMLHAIEIPPVGGDTFFANMFAAYADLPNEVKEKVESLQVMISRVDSRPYNYPDRPSPTREERASWPDIAQPVVRTHEENQRKALYVGGNVPWRIRGMAPTEAAPLVTFLQEFAVQPQYTYRHVWQAGDIVLWDNRSAMHRATYYDDKNYRRLLHRTTVSTTRAGAT